MDISPTAQYDDVRCYFEFMDTSATPQYDGIGWIATKRCRVSRNDGLRGFLFVFGFYMDCHTCAFALRSQ